MSKRFYTHAQPARHEECWRIELDGKPIKTPTGKLLTVQGRHIAERIAGEWNDQGELIRPETMPLTRLANVALEREEDRSDLISEIVAYAGTDLLSYRKDTPQDLADRQSAAFDPVLDWATEHGLSLRTTFGILAIDQDPLVLQRLRTHASDYSPLALTLFSHMTAVYGSAILALAVMHGQCAAGEAFDMSRTDERYRADIWGEDEEAEANAEKTRSETVAMAAILTDLSIPPLDRTGAV